MNKTKPQQELHRMAGISALPLIIILGLIFGAGYLLMRGDIDLDFFEEKRSLEMRRLEGFPVTVNISDEEINKQRVIIRNEEELVAFLSHVDKSNALSVEEKIDFEEEMLVGVSSKAFESDGYKIKIRKIYIEKETNTLLISSLISQPSDNCVTAQQLNAGVDLVAVDKTDMNIDFETLRKTVVCKE